MTRGVKKGVLTSEALKEKLGIDIKTKISKLELVVLAKNQGIVTEEQFIKSLPTDAKVLKCYLHSIIQDSATLQRIDNYVVMYSKLFVRGSFIANLLAHEACGAPEKKAIPLPIHIANLPNLYDLVEHEDFKHCFLPERWPSGKKKRWEPVEQVLLKHGNMLKPLLPNWQAFMSVSGWDNAINAMHKMYRANVENHIVVHAKKNAIKLLQWVSSSSEFQEPRDLVVRSFEKLPLVLTIHNDIYTTVMMLREMFGASTPLDYIKRKPTYSKELSQLHVLMTKYGVTNGTYLPISTVGRKYAYLDTKVCRFLLSNLYKEKQQSCDEPTIMDMFGLTPQSLKQRRKALRKRLRSKWKHVKPKLRKKHMQQGMSSSLPLNIQVDSILTDGVGVSMCIKTPVRWQQQHENNGVGNLDNPVFVGIDTNRAKPFVAAVSTCAYKIPETITLTRRQYYHEIKHRIRMKWEHHRSNILQNRDVIDELARHSIVTDMLGYLTTVSNKLPTLEKEYIDNKDRALWRMRLYRLKTSSLDRHVQQIYKLARGRPICLGIGDANFPSTGRGEKAVPTVQMIRSIYKGATRYKNRVLKYKIWEFRTTMCCCACGNVTQKAPTHLTKLSNRLRLCSHCNSTTVGGGAKLRDRDVQAARNMLWLTWYQYFDAERPDYLCRSKTS